MATELNRQEAGSRRQLLRTGIAAATAGTWTHCMAAADHETFSFVIVSDTHLGRNDDPAAEEQLRQGIAEINAGPGDFVLHLGDIVDKARAEHYPRYVAARAELKKPIHEIPGNHDNTELFLRHVTGRIDRSFDHDGVRFVLFGNAHEDSHDGFLAAEQVEWITGECSQAAALGLKIVFCCHVPVHANRHPDRGWYVKPDDGQTAFYDLVEKHSDRVLLCLHGHFHNGIRGWQDHHQVVEVLCPSLCYNQDRNLEEHLRAGRASGFFVPELRTGYTIATLGNGRLTLQYKPLGSQVDAEYSVEWK
ncbi:MAG: metallophosphoesterase [Fuerstiella sp.]|nr:metallophosphoesterase [Fuerstiella sp.]